jgi:hypothetical protein
MALVLGKNHFFRFTACLAAGSYDKIERRFDFSLDLVILYS